MMYQGGKTKLAGQISGLILPRAVNRPLYIEPFLGSAAVMARVAGSFDHVVGADLLPDISLMWQLAVRGWEPPTEVSEELYRSLRNAAPSALRGFVGTACSFGGKWFGGYARDPKSDRNYADQGARSVMARSTSIRRARLHEFWAGDYADVVEDYDLRQAVIYADPPYAGTLAYAGAGRFDTVRFWETAEGWADRGAVVLVSEYAAPAPWVSVWERERHAPMALESTGRRATEHVFMLPTRG